MAGAETRNLSNAATFAACKPDAVFVTVARGVIIDEPALLGAVDSGQLSRACLTSFAQEPLPTDDPLARPPRVIATPHIGRVTYSMLTRSAKLFAENVSRCRRRGENPQWAVNSQ